MAICTLGFIHNNLNGDKTFWIATDLLQSVLLRFELEYLYCSRMVMKAIEIISGELGLVCNNFFFELHIIAVVTINRPRHFAGGIFLSKEEYLLWHTK